MQPAEKRVEQTVHQVPLTNPSTMVWSYSRLNTFERCQRMFWYVYIEKRPTPVTVPMKVGKMFHKAIEWVLGYGYSTEDAIRFTLYEYDGLPDSESFGTLIRLLDNALFYVPANENVSTEVKLSLPTVNGTIQGIIDLLEDDLIEDKVTLYDFKSSWIDSKAEDSMQLKVYGWMFKELRGSAFTGDMFGRLIFPRINKVTEFEFTDEHFIEAKQWFVNQTETILAKPLLKEEWKRTTDKQKCEHCAFAGLCAGEFNGLFPNSSEFANEHEAIAAGEYILQTEAAIKQLKEKLKLFVKKGGKVAIGEGQWHFKASTPKPKVIDTKQWINIVDDMGLDTADYVIANPDKIEEILVHDEDGLATQLVEWTKPRNTFKFGEVEAD